METISKNYIDENEIFLQTSEIFAKQSVLSEEDLVNNWLDRVNEIKGDLQNLYPKFDPYTDRVVKALSKDIDKTGLIVKNEYINNLKRSISKLINTIEKKPKTNASFRSDKEILKTFLSDLLEISNDINKRINSNTEVEKLLTELSDF